MAILKDNIEDVPLLNLKHLIEYESVKNSTIGNFSKNFTEIEIQNQSMEEGKQPYDQEKLSFIKIQDDINSAASVV